MLATRKKRLSRLHPNSPSLMNQMSDFKCLLRVFEKQYSFTVPASSLLAPKFSF